jgi:hypothetical protein
MADLSDLNSAQFTKIIGSDGSGVEQTPVSSSANGDLNTRDLINNALLSGNLSVSTATIAKVGGSNLSNRKFLTIMPIDKDIYWGYNSSVSTSNGTPIFRAQMLSLSVSDLVNVYIISSGGTADVRIVEGS